MIGGRQNKLTSGTATSRIPVLKGQEVLPEPSNGLKPVKVERSSARDQLASVRGGGCLGAIGGAFALWFALIGTLFAIGWRDGDFSGKPGIILAGVFVGLLSVAGLGIATFRDRFLFDRSEHTVTRAKSLFFIPYRSQEWSIDDFEEIELQLREIYPRDGGTRRLHVIRLLPASGGSAFARESYELGSGPPGEEMRRMAKQLAEFSCLPLRESPAIDS